MHLEKKAYQTAALRNGKLPPSYIHIWTNCGDCGPDEIGMRNVLHSEMAHPKYDCQWFFSLACLKHQLHLLVKDSMKLANRLLRSSNRSYKYFSAIAQLTHTWRANGVKFCRAWSVVTQNPWEYKAASTVPPLAVAGRWGSVDSTTLI